MIIIVLETMTDIEGHVQGHLQDILKEKGQGHLIDIEEGRDQETEVKVQGLVIVVKVDVQNLGHYLGIGKDLAQETEIGEGQGQSL